MRGIAERPKIKVVSIAGTRPEIIKIAPVILELRRRSLAFEQQLWLSDQHRDMIAPYLRLFELQPDHVFTAISHSSLNHLFAAFLPQLEALLTEHHPDVVLVVGDTLTATVGALAAFNLQIPVGHVEAGLRSFDLAHPFPEEGYRRIISSVASLHFAPSARARQQLVRAGAPARRIILSGNTVIDAVLWVASQDLSPYIQTLPGALQQLIALPQERADRSDTQRRLVLVTAHRRENWGEPLANVTGAVRDLAIEFGDRVAFVFAMHVNPTLQQAIRAVLEGLANVQLVPPLEYPQLVASLRAADIVLTDSGGLQEEAPALGKPVLVMRTVTERPEPLEAGVAELVGTDRERIRQRVRALLTDDEEYRKMARAIFPYGDGHAAQLVVDRLALLPD
ncbi:MAG: UDP-N-acetylglucosamine 2-epimerase (non-hydrolyzing) [Chloroflexi bacterium]|nr:UDP-N-acetylglucosamine 2-epimerase (non-hydrolyzing) [Chloroflexota bacterium]